MLIPLVFFGAGVLFASLIWGKYKQLAIALRQKADRHQEAEATLQESMNQIMAKHADQSTTCRTLEEELAHIATERESLLADLAEARAERTRLKDLESELASITERCQAHEECADALRKELDQTKEEADAATVAENRAKQLEAEKAEVLTLVSKLQEKLDTFVPVRRQLQEEQQAVQSLARSVRLERVRRRRIAHQNTADDTYERRRAPRHRKKQRYPIHTVRVAEATPAMPAPINGHHRPGVARRVLARLLPSASVPSQTSSAPPAQETKVPSRNQRHW